MERSLYRMQNSATKNSSLKVKWSNLYKDFRIDNQIRNIYTSILDCKRPT